MVGAEDWETGPWASDRKGGLARPKEGWETMRCGGQADFIESSSLSIEGNGGIRSISE